MHGVTTHTHTQLILLHTQTVFTELLIMMHAYAIHACDIPQFHAILLLHRKRTSLQHQGRLHC